MKSTDRNDIIDPATIILGLGYACTLLVTIGWVASLGY